MSDVAKRQESEVGILAGVRAGEAGAFERMVRTYMPRMLGVARRITRNEVDAEDAVQEAFVQALRAVGKFEGRSSLGTWLHQITVRCCLMILRKRRSRDEGNISGLMPEFKGDGHHAVEVAAWGPSVAELAASEEMRGVVRAKIDELPEGYRIVLVVRDIEGMDTREAAELLGISEDALKVKLHRARQALRKLLEPYVREGAR